MKKEPTLKQAVDFLKGNDVLEKFEEGLKTRSYPTTMKEYWKSLVSSRDRKSFISAAFIWPDEEVDFWDALDDKYRESFTYEC